MITITDGTWITDLEKRTCRNISNKVVVRFTKRGDTFQGEIIDMPVSFLEALAQKPHGDKTVKKMIAAAEEVFSRAYYQSLRE